MLDSLWKPLLTTLVVLLALWLLLAVLSARSGSARALAKVYSRVMWWGSRNIIHWLWSPEMPRRGAAHLVEPPEEATRR